MKMTDAYEYQSFYNLRENITVLDCRDVEGTRCYLDDVAKEELLRRMAELDASGVHFIDSGNYHYLSLLWLMKIDRDFNLVLFDHHPDDQPPSFGQITSCGGWVLEAKEMLPYLKNVYTFGVGEVHDVENTYVLDYKENIGSISIASDLPLFISIDKDVLSTDYAITDWDQGDMTIDEMLLMLGHLFESFEVIGVDICGESGEMAENAALVNNQTNQLLFDFLSEKF
jgi:arginase family enzyme